MANAAELIVLESDDGVLVLGDETSLRALDSLSERVRPLKPSLVARAFSALEGWGDLQGQSGRWLKMDDATAKTLQEYAAKNPKITGVIRGEGGRIVKHMQFEPAGLLNPGAASTLAAIASQQAIMSALDDISEYLEAIDEKLDRLLKQRKVEALAQIGGVSLVLDEASRIHEATGAVSAVTWSKVQANSLALQTMIAECLAQLHALADQVAQKKGDVDAIADVLREVETDAPFWLGVLARTVSLQDRQYLIELARVEGSQEGDLDQHREGILIARTERARRVGQSLALLMGAIRESSTLTPMDKVINPFSAQRVTDRSNRVTEMVNDLARHIELDVDSAQLLESMGWVDAALAVVSDATDHVSKAAKGAASRVRSLGQQIKKQREEALLEKADQIRSHRELQEKSAEQGEADQDT